MIPSPPPTEPCLFFYRVHQLQGGKGLKTAWAQTHYIARAQGHPYDLQVTSGHGRRWMPNNDQAHLYHLSHVSARAGYTPHPNTMYEVVQIPRRLIPQGLPDFRACEIVDNIRPDILRGLRRQQHGELEDVFVEKLPQNDMEANAFYINGAAFLKKLQGWAAPVAAATTPPAPAPASGPASAPATSGSTPSAPASPRPSTAHKALAARQRPPRTTDPRRLLQTIKQIRRIKQGGEGADPAAEEAAPQPSSPTTSKMSGP